MGILGYAVSDVAPKQIERAMGQIDNIHETQDQGESRRQQKKKHSEHQAVQRLYDKEIHWQFISTTLMRQKSHSTLMRPYH